MNRSLALLVLSCDKYSDLWSPFFECFEKNFPTWYWPIYLGSNTKKHKNKKILTILSGADSDWSTSYKRILEQIPERKLFVILEDLFLSSSVDEYVLRSLVEFMFEKNASHIRYWANPVPDLPTDNPLIGQCAKGAPYRSTVCGLWDREYLLGLLIDGESPWNFEIMGSYRTSYSEGFYALKSPLCEYKNMVEKNRWVPASVNWAERNGIYLSLEVRPILRGRNYIKSLAQMALFNLVLHIPWKWRVNFMNQFRKLIISY